MKSKSRKQFDLKKDKMIIFPIAIFLIVFFVLVGGLLKWSLTGIPDPIPAKQVSTILVSNNLKPVDATDSAQGNFLNAGLTSCIIVEQDDIHFEFYEFDNSNSATRVYREAHTLIVTEKMSVPRVQIKESKMNYKFYSLAANGHYSVTLYVKNTAIYAYCDKENQSKINNILDMMGYIEAKPKAQEPSWLASVMRILVFGIFIPFVLVSRSFWKRAAYLSAGVTQKQIDDLEMTRKEIPNWLLEVSPKQSTTKALLTVCKLYLLPIYIGIIIAVINCFTGNMNDILNTIATYFPLAIIVFAMLGALIAKKVKAKNK